MRKVFPCGHKGKGQFCRPCREAEVRERENARQKEEWRSRLAAAPIPLDHLPQGIAEKALEAIEAIRSGRPHAEFEGKRLATMGQRDVIVIRLGRRYRLICRDLGGRREFVEAISHETYNRRISSGGWA